MGTVTPTPKHLRQRWRYLAVEIETWATVELQRSSVQSALWRAARELLGDVGSAQVELSVLGFAAANGQAQCVVRTRRGEVSNARAVIACVSSIDDQPVRPYVGGVSGTVRACEEKYLGRDTETIPETPVEIDGIERTGYRRGDRVDIRRDERFLGATTLDIE